MNKSSLLDDYLNKYAVSPTWTLCAISLEEIERVIVIPAYAELEMLFDTLASIADNPTEYLDRTLVICVINNKEDCSVDIRKNNSLTLKVLSYLAERQLNELSHIEFVNPESLKKIAQSRIRLGYIDASSPGCEIPKNAGGVGMARKIGMDMALRIFHRSQDGMRLILSLDADTLVRPDYLPAVQNAFNKKKTSTAVLAYEHQMPTDELRRSAICAYEIYLRYWVWGLKYAGSPYAFHSIGSTIVTTDRAYLTVRGMNRREAGEDFYFLNKLAKIGSIHTINNAKVYPSARISERVPFGTGATIGKITADQKQDYGFYDPVVFVILKTWLECMKTSYGGTVEQMQEKAKSIHVGLEQFLLERKFTSIWLKILGNVKDSRTYERQFHEWFDGFETLKLVNNLTRRHFPKIGMVPALRRMMELQNIEWPVSGPDNLNLLPEDQITLLRYMQSQRISDAPSYRYLKR